MIRNIKIFEKRKENALGGMAMLEGELIIEAYWKSKLGKIRIPKDLISYAKANGKEYIIFTSSFVLEGEIICEIKGNSIDF